MASLIPPADVAAILAQLESAPGLARLRELLGPETAFSPELMAAVLEEAARFSDTGLAPFNVVSDRQGCRIEDGRVRTAPGHPELWRDYLAAGWLGIDQPVEHGGQGLPMAALAACQEVFERGSVAFGMLPTSQRAAARLLAAHADEAIQAEWLPKLVAGDWGATICISEPEAGSDVGRIRTLASPDGDGWRITGEKIWISYGDHDLAPRIGHCLLARTPDAPPGAQGLSLFLVPDRLDDGGRNGVFVRGIEEKLGLHGSPTCAMGFEAAQGRLIGVLNRGLAQLFTMITTMRLMVSVQALGVAGAAADVALAYAEDRRQGGRPDAPAVPISAHADVQRMLLDMTARAEVLRGLVLAAAVQADIARLSPDPGERERAQALTGWLLPIGKTFGGELAQANASDAIQVLGGAGYVRDWPAEQLLRDSRVFTIYEGTSGIQALDLLHRRLRRDGGKGLYAFLDLARAEVERAEDRDAADALDAVLRALADEAGGLAAAAGDAAAYPFLQLSALAATGWIALRLVGLGGSDRTSARLRAAGRRWLHDLPARAALEQHRIARAEAALEPFEAIRRTP